MPYFESTNLSLLGKRALWNFDGKCLPFTSIAELFYNYWKTICGTAGANQSFQTFMDLEPRSSLNMKQKKKSATKNSLKKVDTDTLFKLIVLTPYYFIALLYFFL